MNEIILNSDTHNRLLGTAENRKARRLWPTQTLHSGSVQLGQIVGETASLVSDWCSSESVSRRTLCMSSPLLTFQTLAFW